jgi:hypothetical protein
LMFIYFFKRLAPFVIVAALSFRLYKYLTLISPESGVFYILVFVVRHVLYFIVP